MHPLLAQYAHEVAEIHRRLSLWNNPPEVSLYGILAAYDSMLLPRMMDPNPTTSLGALQNWKEFDEGFAQAIRWHLSTHPGSSVQPVAVAGVISEGAELLIHAQDYFNVEYFHRRMGLRLVTAQVEEGSRTVRFLPDMSSAGKLATSAYGDRAVGISARRHQQGETKYAMAMANVTDNLKYSLKDGRVLLQAWKKGPLSPDLIQTIISMITFDDWLSPNDDLVGFSLGELDAFWATVMVLSICATRFYLAEATRGAQERCMPTQVVARAEFISTIAAGAGISTPVVENILQRLTIDSRQARPDIFLQPFLSDGNVVAWSVFIAQTVQHRRNMLKLMARTADLRNVAANLIGRREKSLLQDIAETLRKRGVWQCSKNTEFFSPGEGEIDLLGYSAKYPDEVLLIEGKAVLEVDELQEMRAATDQMTLGQKQLRRSLDRLLSLNREQQKLLFPFVDWTRVKHFYPVVVTPDSEPLPSLDQSEIPAIAFDSMKLRLRSSDWRSPSRLWHACHDRRWLPNLTQDDIRYRTLKLGDVNYELPVYSLG